MARSSRRLLAKPAAKPMGIKALTEKVASAAKNYLGTKKAHAVGQDWSEF